jgi:hypothetical protein
VRTLKHLGRRADPLPGGILKEDGTPMAIYASWTAGSENVLSRAGTVASVSFGNQSPALGPP